MLVDYVTAVIVTVFVESCSTPSLWVMFIIINPIIIIIIISSSSSIIIIIIIIIIICFWIM